MRSIAIKHKIILAFSAIGLLMLTSSLFFYWSLNKISTTTSRIENLAVPAQQVSKDLRLSLLSITKFNALAYSQTKPDLLLTNKKEALSEQQEFSNMLNALKPQLTGQQNMQTLLVDASKNFEQLSKTSANMFNAKEQRFTAQSAATSLIKEFGDELSNLSNALLDIELIEINAKQQSLLNSVFGTATRIDDLLFNLSNNIKSITQTTSVSDLNVHQQDTQFLLDNIQPNFVYLEQQATPFGDNLNAAQFTEQFNNLRSRLNGPDGIYAQQNKALENTQMAQQSFERFQQEFIDTESQLLQLNKLADERFQTLQNSAKSAINMGSSSVVIIAIVLIGLLIVISIFTTNAMLKPLKKVNSDLARIASGDFSKRSQPRSKDEFGTLLNNINKLSDDLSHLIKAISNDAHELDKSAIQTSEKGQQMTIVAQQQLERSAQATDLSLIHI